MSFHMSSNPSSLRHKKTKAKEKRSKRRRSKHVLRSGQEHVVDEVIDEQSGVEGNASRNLVNDSASRRSRQLSKIVKDPMDALAYLTAWKESTAISSGGRDRRKDDNEMDEDDKHDPSRRRGTSSTSWKFNKNTQSWLIRHMYEPDKVSKGTFALLMEYLLTIPAGSTAWSRICQDAARRAARYKQYNEKKCRPNNTAESRTDAALVVKESSSAEQNDTNDDDVDDDDDDERWMKLNDHDKRKEYKRARKILDLLHVSRDG